MEKIYMEENNNKKGKRGVVDASVILSFVVAIFAVFSLATLGITMNQKSGVSYAAPIGTTTESFNFSTGESIIGNGGIMIPIYMADGHANTPIFCVEHNVSVEDDTQYTKGGVIDDYGLLYLLRNSYANEVDLVADDNHVVAGKSTEVNAWITQAAIWMYLYETKGDVTASGVDGIEPAGSDNIKINYMSESMYNGIKSVTTLTEQSTGTVIYTAQNLYDTYIKDLVNNAKEASNKKMLTVSKKSDDVTQSEDKKFYVSDEITVTGNPSSDFNNFTVSLTGIDGAKIIDKDGNELTGDLQPGTKFFVRIPADKVTKEVQKVTVNVSGNFNTLTGNYYVGKNGAGLTLQKVVSVTGTTKTENAGTSVEFVGTEDTGMNTAQTIYFIGLIVLLCGVGIVYANAKPVQVKQ